MSDKVYMKCPYCGERVEFDDVNGKPDRIVLRNHKTDAGTVCAYSNRIVGRR